MLDLIAWGFWFALGAYSFWFFTKAKTLQPLTLDDLALTWRVHKQQIGCNASRIHSLIVKDDHIVGFKCACGHEFLQKRLITKKVPINIQTGIALFELSKDGNILMKAKGSLTKLGVHFSHIKEI